MKVLVTGATGFVGPRVVHALRAQDRDVRVLVRRPERAAQVAGWGAELATGDITEPTSLTAAITGCTHVVHLVAILRGSSADFERVMTQGTKDLLAAATAEGVEQFVLMSALGTSETSKDSVPYFAAKWNEEQAVLASGLQHTIFRPSFIFGRGGALPLFVKQVRYSPVVTVIGDGRQRSQPVWVEDVATIVAQAVGNPQVANRTFELGGPDTVTWNELYLTIAKVLGKRRRLAHVPFGLARVGARVTQLMPKAPLTADQVTMLQGADNVVTNTDAVDTFQLPLLGLEEQIRRSA